MTGFGLIILNFTHPGESNNTDKPFYLEFNSSQNEK